MNRAWFQPPQRDRGGRGRLLFHSNACPVDGNATPAEGPCLKCQESRGDRTGNLLAALDAMAGAR